MATKETFWKRTSDGGYKAWLGNGMYAVIRPVMKRVFSPRYGIADKRGKSREVRHWAAGVVAENWQGNTEVRGFPHGLEYLKLSDAKKSAIFEAKCVGRAMLDIISRVSVLEGNAE